MGRFSALASELDEVGVLVRGAYEEVSRVDHHVTAADLAELMQGLSSVGRSAQAGVVAAIAQFARREEVDDPRASDQATETVHQLGYVEEFASTEVALTLGISTRSADTRVGQATRLVCRAPRVLGRVADGSIEMAQALGAVQEMADIDSDEQCAAVDEFVAARIGSADPTRLAQLTRYAISRIAPTALRERAKASVADRCFDICPGPAGLAEVYALVPAAQAAALWEATAELARGHLEDDPALTLDQARADAFIDLALANATVTARVDLGLPVVAVPGSGLGESLPSGPDCPTDTGLPATSEEASEEWDRRRDVDGDAWFDQHLHQAGAHGDSAAPQSQVGGVGISGVHLPTVGYVPSDVVGVLMSRLGTRSAWPCSIPRPAPCSGRLATHIDRPPRCATSSRCATDDAGCSVVSSVPSTGTSITRSATRGEQPPRPTWRVCAGVTTAPSSAAAGATSCAPTASPSGPHRPAPPGSPIPRPTCPCLRTHPRNRLRPRRHRTSARHPSDPRSRQTDSYAVSAGP